MTRYVAFLRAINLAGAHVVKMDHLRSLFENLGLSDVQTFINSGNVIFHSKSKPGALEKKIAARLRQTFGFEIETFIRSADELAAIACYKPFDDADLAPPDSVLYVGFLAEKPTAEAAHSLVSQATPVDVFHVSDREIYWLLRTKFMDSNFSGGKLEKILGMKTTLRNTTTIKKIVSKYCS